MVNGDEGVGCWVSQPWTLRRAEAGGQPEGGILAGCGPGHGKMDGVALQKHMGGEDPWLTASGAMMPFCRRVVCLYGAVCRCAGVQDSGGAWCVYLVILWMAGCRFVVWGVIAVGYRLDCLPGFAWMGCRREIR